VYRTEEERRIKKARVKSLEKKREEGKRGVEESIVE
jgi:hypothetical protein